MLHLWFITHSALSLVGMVLAGVVVLVVRGRGAAVRRGARVAR